MKTGIKVIATNKNAIRNYEFIETLEAGMVLKGTEVKSLYSHEVTMKDSYVTIKNNAAWLLNCHIPVYKFGNITNHVPDATRKLLLNKRQILNWNYKQKKDKLVIVPIKIYWRKNKIKIEIALARGLKQFDKREIEKKKEMQRESKDY